MELVKKIESANILRKIMLVVIGTLLLTVSAKIKVPFYPVPMTMQTFVVVLIGITLGWKLGIATIFAYLFEGAIGLPVFAGTPEKGIGVSYGSKFVSDRKTKLAVVSIGYADGINRNLSDKINLIHNKKLYPQVGSITMDQMMVDITESNDIEVGSTMLLLGSEGDKTISPIDWANESKTIPWEILCSFKNRIPRVQID